MYIMKKFILYMALGMQFFLYSICLCSCQMCADFVCPVFGSLEKINVEVPENCRLLYVDSSGAVVEMNLESGMEKLCLVERKNAVVPVLAFCEGEAFPRGTILPFEKRLSAEDGFAASILMGLYAGSDCSGEQTFVQVQEFISHFNWKRFIEECRLLEDPWSLDRELIMQNIATQTFSKRDLR